MRTGITVQNVDPTEIVVVARQHPGPRPFGIVEIVVGEFSVMLFAQGEDASRTLLTKLRTAATIEIEMRP